MYAKNENKKKTKSPSESVESRSENSADNFPLKVFFLLKTPSKLQPSSEENSRTEFFYGQSVEVLLSKYNKYLLKFWEKFVNIYLLKKFSQKFHLDTGTPFSYICQKKNKKKVPQKA